MDLACCHGNRYDVIRALKVLPNNRVAKILGSLSTRDFETQTATGSDPFSLSTCFHSTTFIVLSIFSPLEMISIKI